MAQAPELCDQFLYDMNDISEEIMLTAYIPKVMSKRPGGFFNSVSTLLMMDSTTYN